MAKIETLKNKVSELRREAKELQIKREDVRKEYRKMYEGIENKYVKKLGEKAYKDVWIQDYHFTADTGYWDKSFDWDVVSEKDKDRLHKKGAELDKLWKEISARKEQAKEIRKQIKKIKDKEQYGITPSQREAYTEVKRWIRQKARDIKEHEENMAYIDGEVNKLLKKLEGVDLEALGGIGI